MIRTVYGALVVGLAAFWLFLLAGPVGSVHPETDLWWMMPFLEAELQGRGGLETITFLLSPAPLMLGQPFLKLYLWLHTCAVGLPLSALLWLALGIHGLNALALYGLNRRLGFPRRAGVISGVVYLTMFVHFHAYLWPPAVQHLMAVLTTLLLLNLYLWTEERVLQGEKPGASYGAALGLTALASLQRSALLGPILMLVHTLFGSSEQERKARFDRWLPAWILCGIYPSFALTTVGDPRITRFFTQGPLLAPARTLLLFGVFVGILLLIRAALPVWERSYRFRVAVRWLAGAAVAAGIVAWALWDSRQWLFLYNAVVPFAVTLTSFLEPIRTVLLVNSAEPYHHIPPQVSPWTLLEAVGLVSAFVAFAPRRRGVLPIFIGWYAVSLLHLLRNYASFPVQLPSRYFVYLSPIFAILFAVVFFRVVEASFKRFRVQPVLQELGAVALIALLCIPNIVGIRLELFRGRLANTYLLYGDLRGSALQENGGEDPFDRAMRRAEGEMGISDLRGARDLYRHAARVRPFSLRYILSPYRLEDTRWLTGGMDLRQWAAKTGGLYVSWGKELPDMAPAFEQTTSQLHQELSDYLLCLFTLSYLEYRSGNVLQSQHWLSQMGFLEQDGWRLSLWIQEDARVKSNPDLLEFAQRLGLPGGFPEALPWRKDDYGFGLFMVRFLTQW